MPPQYEMDLLKKPPDLNREARYISLRFAFAGITRIRSLWVCSQTLFSLGSPLKREIH